MNTSIVSSECPWFGPVPCKETDVSRFFGRRNEIFDLLQRVRVQDVTILSSDSGSGKTSLINAGLVPALRLLRHKNSETIGFTLCVRTWDAVASVSTSHGGILSQDADASVVLMVNAIDHAINELVEMSESFSELLSGYEQLKIDIDSIVALQEMYRSRNIQISDVSDLSTYIQRLRNVVIGEKLILIVDQAEEFMGSSINSLSMHEKATKIILEISKISNVRIVLSLRDEYLGKLRSLEQSISALAPRTVYLNPLSWSGALDTIIRAANGYENVVVDEEAINLLIENSLPADARIGDIDIIPVDMLGIQACLYELFNISLDVSGKHIVNVPLVSKYIQDVKDNYCISDAEISTNFFLRSLLKWVDRCFDVDKMDKEIDRKVVEEFKDNKFLVLRVAGNMGAVLSTPKGYKSHITKRFLIYNSIREYAKNVLNDRDRSVTSLEKGDKFSLFRKDITLSKNFDAGSHGPIIERLFNAGEIAVHLLVKGNVLKTGGLDHLDDNILTLQHDGYGQAFNSWCDDDERREDDCLVPDVGVYGAEIKRRNGISRLNLEKIVWQSCFVNSVKFSYVTFTLSEFVGSYFDGCHFIDCKFVKCSFDGAFLKGGIFKNVSFVDCNMRGILFEEAAWDTVEFERCNLSSGVVRSIDLNGNLSFSGCDLHYTQVYKFKSLVDDKSLIGASHCRLWGALFVDYDMSNIGQFHDNSPREINKLSMINSPPEE